MIEINPKILLINNRPIASLPANSNKKYGNGSIEVTLDWWEKHSILKKWKEQPNRILISASFINKTEDIKKLKEIPCDACLVGNSLMRADNRIKFLNSLIE